MTHLFIYARTQSTDQGSLLHFLNSYEQVTFRDKQNLIKVKINSE